jgi:hypothetical protein
MLSTEDTERRRAEESSVTASSACRSSVTEITGKTMESAQINARRGASAAAFRWLRTPINRRRHHAKLPAATNSQTRLRKSSILYSTWGIYSLRQRVKQSFHDSSISYQSLGCAQAGFARNIVRVDTDGRSRAEAASAGLIQLGRVGLFVDLARVRESGRPGLCSERGELRR